MKNSLRTVAVAILYQEGKFLMQLRDNIPTIIYPGHWGFFGGHLEPDETPTQGVKREVLEEINYELKNPTLFRRQTDDVAIRYVFYEPLTVPLTQLVLQEGADLALVSPEAIQQGACYSTKLKQIFPLGTIHQKILLDFMQFLLE
ncbi:MAG: NUDIX hydrolase [Cyanobacteria bacterium P01_G01_bin.49]